MLPLVFTTDPFSESNMIPVGCGPILAIACSTVVVLGLSLVLSILPDFDTIKLRISSKITQSAELDVFFTIIH